jgi:hypothetical protein
LTRSKSLLLNEVVTPHQSERIPSGQWGIITASTGRKEPLPVNEVVVSHWPEGNPSGHVRATPKSPQAWEVVLGANSQKIKKIYNINGWPTPNGEPTIKKLKK